MEMEAGWFDRKERKDHKNGFSIGVGLDPGLWSMCSLRSLRLRSEPCYQRDPRLKSLGIGNQGTGV